MVWKRLFSGFFKESNKSAVVETSMVSHFWTTIAFIALIGVIYLNGPE
jgi:hypothetical protein